MILHFPRRLVDRLVDHARIAPAHCKSYAQKITEPHAPVRPGLFLIGDNGVYLMSNGEPPLLQSGETPRDRHVVAYAREINPEILPFDTWYDAKRHAFGGDDGVELIPLGDIVSALRTYPPHEDLMLDLTLERIAVISYAARKPGRKIRQDKPA